MDRIASVIGLGLLFIWFRIPLAQQPQSLNPDEAELLAVGRQASRNLAPYETFTTSTFGPIWPEMLGILRNLGVPLTLPMAHILSLLIWLSIFSAFSLLSSKNIKPIIVFLSFLPILITTAMGGVPYLGGDIVALNTELLAVFWCSIALVLILKWNSTYAYVLSGFFLGFAFFTKYQSAIVCLTLVLAIYLKSISGLDSKPLRYRLYHLLFGFVSFVFALLASHLIFGSTHGLYESIMFTLDYGRGQFGNFANATLADRFWIGGKILFKSWGIVSTILLVLILLTSSRGMAQKFLILGVIVSGFVAMSSPGNEFSNYSIFLIWTLAAGLLLAFRFAVVNDSNFRTVKVEFAAVLSILVLFALEPKGPVNKVALEPRSFAESTQVSQYEGVDGKEVLLLCPQGSKVVTWGWASELYSIYDWEPVDKITNESMRVIWDWKDKSVHEERIVNALNNKGTRCLVSALGPKHFANLDEKLHSVEVVSQTINSELSLGFRKHYFDDSGLTVYVRIDSN